MLLELVKQSPVIITAVLTFIVFIIVFKKINKITKLSFGKEGLSIGGYESHKDCPNASGIRELWYKSKKVYAQREENLNRIMRIELCLMLDEQKEVINSVLSNFAVLAKAEYLEKLREIGQSLLDKDPQVQAIVHRMYGEFYFYAEHRLRELITTDIIKHNRAGGNTSLINVQDWIMEVIKSLMIGREEGDKNLFIDYGKIICEKLKYEIQSMIDKIDGIRSKYIYEINNLKNESKQLLEQLEIEEKNILGF